MQKGNNNRCLVLTIAHNIPLELQNARNNKYSKILFLDYQIEDLIGHGTYADVYLAKHLKTKQQYALKVTSLTKLQQKHSKSECSKILELIDRQENLLKECDSLFVIKCFATYDSRQCKVSILEYCNGGTLLNYLEQNDYCLQEDQAIDIIKQICIGVHELYKKSIIHRDIKLENILRDKGIFKIIDLGFGKKIEHRDQIIEHTQLGTPYTMAPEVHQNQPYGAKADIFSIGIVLLRLVLKNIPYEERVPKKLKGKVLNKNNKPLSSVIVDAITKMTEPDPEKRIGWSDLLAHAVFANRQHITESKIKQLLNQQFSDLIRNSDILLSNFSQSRFTSKKEEESLEHQDQIKITVPRIKSKRQQNIIIIPQESQTAEMAESGKNSNLIKITNAQAEQYFNQKLSKSQEIHPNTSNGLGRVSSNVTGYGEEPIQLRKKSQSVTESFSLRINHSGVKFVPLNQEALIEKNKFKLLIKKSEYILNKLVKELERKDYGIVDITEKRHVKLMFLLTQRAFLDLSQAQSFFQTYSSEQQYLSHIRYMQGVAKKKHLKYRYILYELNNSFFRKIWKVTTSAFKSESDDIKKLLFEGFVDLTQKQQLEKHTQLTIGYIDNIIGSIHLSSLAKRLRAYRKVMQLNCSDQDFEKCLQSILEKF